MNDTPVSQTEIFYLKDGTPHLLLDIPAGMTNGTPDRKMVVPIMSAQPDHQARLDLHYASQPNARKFKVIGGQYAGWVGYTLLEKANP